MSIKVLKIHQSKGSQVKGHVVIIVLCLPPTTIAQLALFEPSQECRHQPADSVSATGHRYHSHTPCPSAA